MGIPYHPPSYTMSDEARQVWEDMNAKLLAERTAEAYAVPFKTRRNGETVG